MKNGLIKEYYGNEQLYSECVYINGKRNGLYKLYYDNGQLYIECNYINGKRNGFYKSYFRRGQLEYVSYDIYPCVYYLEYCNNKFTINI